MKKKKDYVAIYKKDPFTVSLNIDHMKNGSYYIKGKVAKEAWFEACLQMDVPAAGHCSIECTLDKRGNVIKIYGEIKTRMRRTCVRTLEEFDENDKIIFHEQVFFDDKGVDEITVILHGSVLEMKEYFIQQIILHMNSYPVHPKTLSAKKGEFSLDDDQEEALKRTKEEKNPFSVLKGLKSDS